ncbi:MAG: ABC transporter permease [Magnetococcales bacterium]|nr:ABC transporter permease [Magnetococcales bacterium]
MSSPSDPSLKVTHYSSEAKLRHPVALLKGIAEGMMESRELAWQLFLRDIRQRYRQSVLGILWVIIPPLVTTLIFIFLNERKILNIAETDIPYPIYVMIGTLLWQLFSESVSTPLKQFESCTPIMIKINMPREAPILSSLLQMLFLLMIQSLMALAAILYFDITFTWAALLAFPLALMMILMGTVAGVLLIPLGALYKDVGESVGILLRFLFFLTPIVYPPPESWPYSLLVQWNPVTPLLMGARDLITKGVVVDIVPVLVVSGGVVVVGLLSLVFFRVAVPIVLERLGS